jgi:hypothetical protein
MTILLLVAAYTLELCGEGSSELVLDEGVLARGLSLTLTHAVKRQSGDGCRDDDRLLLFILLICTSSPTSTPNMMPTTISPPTTDTTAVKVK